MPTRPSAKEKNTARVREHSISVGGSEPLQHHLTVLAELEDRIHDLEHMDEKRFGSFTRVDWLLCFVGSFLLPYLCYLWFWP
jgi:hypothetical protein